MVRKMILLSCIAFIGFIFIARGQESQSAAKAQASPEDAKGKKLMERACDSCHGGASGWVHSREEWEAITPDMAGRAESLTDEELKILITYLTKFFGPETK